VAADTAKADAGHLWRQGLLLHFFAHLALAADAEAPLDARGLGRVHHRILYIVHFAPGITVGELLGVLRVTHQNVQRALGELDRGGLVAFKQSKEDRRLKLLYSTPKGDRLLEAVSAKQRERIERAYEACSTRDVEGFFAVLSTMIDPTDLGWIERLTHPAQDVP
jgi:DNA-binding MarR family transcriptional regulator